MNFQYPIDLTLPNTHIGQLFGQHARDYSPLLGHPGTDILAPEGTPVYAMCDSYVFESTETPDGYGKHIKLWYEENGHRYVVPYGHFSKRVYPDLPAGFSTLNFVRRGALIGLVGSTGFSNANHVHVGKYEYVNGMVINQNNGYGGAINIEPELGTIEFKTIMELVNNNGAYSLEGEKGYLGINKVEFLNELLKITAVIENRPPQGNQLGVIETAPVGFIIKNN